MERCCIGAGEAKFTGWTCDDLAVGARHDGRRGGHRHDRDGGTQAMTEQLVRVTLGGAHTLYTYRWTGSKPLRRGEKVLVPVSDPESGAEAVCTATVALIGSDYGGSIKDVVRRQHPWERNR